MVEATTDESNIMRYKLVTLPKKTARIPVITIGNSSITLVSAGQPATITPTTTNFTQGNATLGYTAILSNSDAAYLQVTKPIASNIAFPIVPRFIGDSESAQTVTAVGFTFDIVAKQQLISDVTATLTVIGNETGGRATVNITVKKVSVATASNTSIVNAQ